MRAREVGAIPASRKNSEGSVVKMDRCRVASRSHIERTMNEM